MAEILLDDNKICIPNRLKISTFLSELQKKTKQIIYLINDKEIGVFQSVTDVKRGMWRRLKPSDGIAHYYIDPETQNEYTIFSEECANKLGSFPYEGPNKLQLSTSQDKSVMYQQTIQSTRPPMRPQSNPSLQQPVPNSFQQSNPSLQQPVPNSFQQSIPSLQQPVPNSFQQFNPSLQQPIPNSFQQFNPSLQQPIPNSFQQPNPMYQIQNFGYQKPQEQSKQNTNIGNKMNSKTLQNMNRILAYQKHSNPSEPTQPQWFSNLDANSLSGSRLRGPELGDNHQTTYPSMYTPQTSYTNQSNYSQPMYPNQQLVYQNQSNYTSQPMYPGQINPNYEQQMSTTNGPMVNGPATNITMTNRSVANRSVANGSVANGSVANGSVANGSVARPASNKPVIPMSSVQSVQISQEDLKDPMKYFPPGTRKRQQNQNVAPQTVSSKLSA
jgi:hypothetical protein